MSICNQIIKRLGEGLTTTNDARRVDEGAWINKLCHKNSLYKEPDHSNRRILTYNGGLTHWGYTLKGLGLLLIRSPRNMYPTY